MLGGPGRLCPCISPCLLGSPAIEVIPYLAKSTGSLDVMIEHRTTFYITDRNQPVSRILRVMRAVWQSGFTHAQLIAPTTIQIQTELGVLAEHRCLSGEVPAFKLLRHAPSTSSIVLISKDGDDQLGDLLALDPVALSKGWSRHSLLINGVTGVVVAPKRLDSVWKVVPIAITCLVSPPPAISPLVNA